MPLNEPSWWYGSGRYSAWQARALSPIAYVYGWIAKRRMVRSDGVAADIPVICVGNFTAGGTGKTPFVCWLVDICKLRALQPAVLTRGFGGRLPGPLWVDRGQHTAEDVGDEPLLIVQHAPVMVARDRALGLREIIHSNSNCDVVIMDDGLQNQTVKKDVSIALIDGRRGFGNGRIIPAGPLRAALKDQMSLVSAVVINHRSGRDRGRCETKPITTELQAHGFDGPVAHATVSPVLGSDSLQGVRVLAYAGIGNPERFFETLGALGADLTEKRVFADHHPLRDREARDLIETAARQNLTLVTTEKDWVRLSPEGGSRDQLKAKTRVVPIVLEMSERDTDTIMAVLEGCLVKR